MSVGLAEWGLNNGRANKFGRWDNQNKLKLSITLHAPEMLAQYSFSVVNGPLEVAFCIQEGLPAICLLKLHCSFRSLFKIVWLKNMGWVLQGEKSSYWDWEFEKEFSWQNKDFKFFFPLSAAAKYPHLSSVFLNGVKAIWVKVLCTLSLRMGTMMYWFKNKA